jgi:hypothetical protein
MFRFAHSERGYLVELHDNLCNRQRANVRVDPLPLASIDAPANFNNLINVPSGGILDTPILVTLLHAIRLSGPFGTLKDNCRIDPQRVWLTTYPTTVFPDQFKSFQYAVLHAVSSEFKVDSLAVELHEKVQTTLKSFVPFSLQPNWFLNVQNLLLIENPFIKICWLRSVVGGWCTSTRFRSVQGRPCIFGCVDSNDELAHYLQCPILWQFARSSLKMNEPSIHFLSRLCISEPTSDKFKLLAFCHALYHTCVNDTECMQRDGMPKSCQTVQRVASELCNYCLHLIKNN